VSVTALDPAFEELLTVLYQTHNFDFSGYKRSTLVRRVRRRMDLLGLDAFVDYADYLEVHPEEFGPLFNTILINVTTFFRDPPAWEHVEREVIPRILAAKRDGEPIRVWSAGCASGEEAYTLAIILCEALGVDGFRERVKIYATDLDDDALERARRGTYTAKEIAAVPEELQARYFEERSGQWLFRNDLRRSVIFGRHDLAQDAPIWLAVLATLGIGLAIGLFHAFGIVQLGLPPFIMTLASLTALRGIGLLITNGATISITVIGHVPSLVPGLVVSVSETVQVPAEEFKS